MSSDPADMGNFVPLDTYHEIVNAMMENHSAIVCDIVYKHELELVDIRCQNDLAVTADVDLMVEIRNEHAVQVLNIRREHNLELAHIRRERALLRFMLCLFVITTALLCGKIIYMQEKHNSKLLSIRHEQLNVFDNCGAVIMQMPQYILQCMWTLALILSTLVIIIVMVSSILSSSSVMVLWMLS